MSITSTSRRKNNYYVIHVRHTDNALKRVEVRCRAILSEYLTVESPQWRTQREAEKAEASPKISEKLQIVL